MSAAKFPPRREVLEFSQVDPQRLHQRHWLERKPTAQFSLALAGEMYCGRAIQITPQPPRQIQSLLPPALRQAPRIQHAVRREDIRNAPASRRCRRLVLNLLPQRVNV